MTVLLSGRNAAANDIELCLGRARWQQLGFPARQSTRRADVLTATGERCESLLRSRSSDCSFTLNGSAILSSSHRQLLSNSPISASTAPGSYEGLLSRSERMLLSTSRHDVIFRPSYTNADRASRTANISPSTPRHGSRGGADCGIIELEPCAVGLAATPKYN